MKLLWKCSQDLRNERPEVERWENRLSFHNLLSISGGKKVEYLWESGSPFLSPFLASRAKRFPRFLPSPPSLRLLSFSFPGVPRKAVSPLCPFASFTPSLSPLLPASFRLALGHLSASYRPATGQLSCPERAVYLSAGDCPCENGPPFSSPL